MEANAHLGLDRIRLKLKRAGYVRTSNAVKIQLTRRELEPEREGYSARQVAQGFGIDVHSVTRWISRGWLRATRKGTLRQAPENGNEWLISEAAIRRFVADNLGAFELAKVDQTWFLSLLLRAG